MAAATSQPEYVTSNIENLRVGDTVLAFNPDTGQAEPRRIVDAFDRTTYRLRVLEIHDLDGTSQTIRTTDEHPFWVVDQQDFKPAGELEVGEELLGPRGEMQTLAATWAEEHPEGVTVYNFEVEGAHTYFVCASDLSETPVLVHNATAGTCLHGNSKLSRKPNHLYVIRNKITGQIQKYGISGGKITGAGKSYRAQSQVNKWNNRAGADIYESDIIAKNLTRTKALSMEKGRVNSYSVARQKAGASSSPKGPPKNSLPKPEM